MILYDVYLDKLTMIIFGSERKQGLSRTSSSSTLAECMQLMF